MEILQSYTPLNKDGQFILEIERHKKIPKNQQALPIPDERRKSFIKYLESLGVFESVIEKIMRDHSMGVLEDVRKDFDLHRTEKERSGEKIDGGYFRAMLPKPGSEYVFSKGYSEKQKSIKNKKIREKEEVQKNKEEEEAGKRAEFGRERRKAALEIYLKFKPKERERMIERLKKKDAQIREKDEQIKRRDEQISMLVENQRNMNLMLGGYQKNLGLLGVSQEPEESVVEAEVVEEKGQAGAGRQDKAKKTKKSKKAAI